MKNLFKKMFPLDKKQEYLKNEKKKTCTSQKISFHEQKLGFC